MTIQEVKQKAARIEVWTTKTGVSLDKFFETSFTKGRLKFKGWKVVSPTVLKEEDRQFRFIIETNYNDVHFVDLPTLGFTEQYGYIKVVFIADANNEIIYAAKENQAIGELGYFYYQLLDSGKVASEFDDYYECTFIVKENPVLVNDALIQLPIGQNKICMYLTSLADIENRINRNSYTELIIRPIKQKKEKPREVQRGITSEMADHMKEELFKAWGKQFAEMPAEEFEKYVDKKLLEELKNYKHE